MKKRTMPEFNTEYTFRFRKGDKQNIVTLIYEGRNAKNRLEFYNKQSKGYTSMPEERFSYILRFNLVSKKLITTEKAPKMPVKPVETDILKEEDISAGEKEMLVKFGSLNAFERAQVESALAMPFNRFYCELEKFIKNNEKMSKNQFDEMFNKIFKASNVLNLKLKFLTA